MIALFRFMDWPLRVKMAVPLIAASLLPFLFDRQRAWLLFASAILLLAVLTILFASVILTPLRSLVKVTQAIAGGDLSARVLVNRGDELGGLGTSFNSMAERIESQALALQRARDEMELRVQERTAELTQTTADLEREVIKRRGAQRRLQAQLERLNLLQHITSAIGERQDLRSIFQVVVITLEDHLPVDFSCICRYDRASNRLEIANIGSHHAELAAELAPAGDVPVSIDRSGLSDCLQGKLMYEPDLDVVQSPFPRRLSHAGLGCMVAAPLLVSGSVFGILIAARRRQNSFSSGDCEFLWQLSEHVALAAHQAQLYGALQEAYEDLRRTQQAVMQQERLRALGQMASGIAHDINNAISPVALYTESLLEREPNLSERARDYLQTIQHAIGDVAETVARMREFYRQRETQMALVAVDANKLIQQVVDLTRARWSDMAQQTGVSIQVETELEQNLPAFLGVESEIREALTNLIFNAVDAMPDGGMLVVRTKTAEGPARAAGGSATRQVCIEVADTGTGMDEDTRRRCLEPFFTTKGERGTGLGLAMVYGVVQRHGAEIDIDSAPGKGTAMRLSFPVPLTAAPEAAVYSSVQATVPQLRILLIDDDPLLLKSVQDTLAGDGHAIATASGGSEGIDAFLMQQENETPFDVVITDLGMPYADGRKVAASVKTASPATPVILLTGWGQRLLAEGDIPPHVDRVLNKPPKMRELREALAYCHKRKGAAAV